MVGRARGSPGVDGVERKDDVHENTEQSNVHYAYFDFVVEVAVGFVSKELVLSVELADLVRKTTRNEGALDDSHGILRFGNVFALRGYGVDDAGNNGAVVVE